jgi:hypothetical protein
MSTPKLLVSVFNPEEVRAAVAGGADIIDCEDPRADVGMFEPRVVTNIAYAVRQEEGLRKIPTSANIGFALQLFERASTGQAVPRSDLEMQAKAAQEALGVAVAMDVGDNRPNILKFGVDGLRPDQIQGLVKAVKKGLRNSLRYQNHKVIGSFIEVDLQEWEERKRDSRVIKALLDLGLFYFKKDGSIDLNDYYEEKDRVERLKGYGHISQHPKVELIDPYDPEKLGLPKNLDDRIQSYTEHIIKAGADGVMIDTPIQAKVARICLVKHTDNKKDNGGGEKLPRHGTIDIDLLKKFVALCKFLGAESWLAGSIQPYHAKELGKIDGLDVVLCRGSASGVVENPYGEVSGTERSDRRILEQNVALMVKNLKGQN